MARSRIVTGIRSASGMEAVADRDRMTDTPKNTGAPPKVISGKPSIKKVVKR